MITGRALMYDFHRGCSFGMVEYTGVDKLEQWNEVLEINWLKISRAEIVIIL